jgi:hypothetical protein
MHFTVLFGQTTSPTELHTFNMRPLTEEETKTFFEKLAK